MPTNLGCALSSADAPQVGERVTLVCAPSRSPARRRGAGLFSTSPPSTRPGQPLAATNHALAREFALLAPPPPASAGAPAGLLPAAVLLAGSYAATGALLVAPQGRTQPGACLSCSVLKCSARCHATASLMGALVAALVDPALPLLLAGGAATALASGVLGRTVLLPRLKQLPLAVVRLETVRQTLLVQVPAALYWFTSSWWGISLSLSMPLPMACVFSCVICAAKTGGACML